MSFSEKNSYICQINTNKLVILETQRNSCRLFKINEVIKLKYNHSNLYAIIDNMNYESPRFILDGDLVSVSFLLNNKLIVDITKSIKRENILNKLGI